MSGLRLRQEEDQGSVHLMLSNKSLVFIDDLS